MKELSNCCNAPVKVDTADEGTSCYMCAACRKPCDLQMKEHVFTKEELNLFREWFTVCEDVNPQYLEAKDYELYNKLQSILGNKIRTCHIEIIEKLKGLDK